jgi:hypothetical protein
MFSRVPRARDSYALNRGSLSPRSRGQKETARMGAKKKGRRKKKAAGGRKKKAGGRKKKAGRRKKRK